MITVSAASLLKNRYSLRWEWTAVNYAYLSAGTIKRDILNLNSMALTDEYGNDIFFVFWLGTPIGCGLNSQF